ncbi:hypothetical protein PUR71_08435 [Streptomyces sp. SP17BM10]|uniref:hypothetical protein n=1 Tax=Streptomyces sp. SP17BM10 TaxID=3002530 RepID=UPI002E79DD5C|nr:hypothetical protein [Streptomyces sp. SP17BM10]MEE1782942.1 hypothetical protein [Streptomyces sp. SP17BM10]
MSAAPHPALRPADPPWPATAARSERILVLGSPGSGKTTLATRLAGATGLPLHHLDDLYWAADWSRPDPRAWERTQRRLVAGPRWIIEGNHLPTIPVRMARADLVVLLDVRPRTCAARAVRRAAAIRRGRHDGLPALVRARAEAGHPVAATQDFPRLLWKIARFRARSLWPAIEHARDNPHTTLVIAVGPGRARRRRARLRRRLRRAGVSALVLTIRQLDADGEA